MKTQAGERVEPAPWYRCSRSLSGLCYWDGPASELAGFNRNRCPVCLALALIESEVKPK